MRFGFEVEIENISTFPPTIPGINVTEDNSLRNGSEYVSGILPDSDFTKSLYGHLYKRLEGDYSERCGVHFHMDVTDKDKAQRMNFIKRYIQVERTMFRLYPEILRSNNNFCNILLDSTEELNIIRGYNRHRGSTDGFSKYMSLNIKPMNTIGTFEFRALKAGVTPEQFNEVIDIFEQLWDVSAPLPFADQIEEADRQEAESVINLINTNITTEQANDEFLDHHFRDGTDQIPTNGISEDAIRQYLNSL